MGGITEERGGTDAGVFGVGRFEDQQSAGLEGPEGISREVSEGVEADVLHEMEGRDQSEAFRRCIFKVGEGVAFEGVEIEFAAGGEHTSIEIHAQSGDAA